MNFSDDEHPLDPDDAAPGAPSEGLPAVEEIPPSPPPAPDSGPPVPEDLHISWSWLHLVVFLLFSVGSLFFIQLTLSTYLIAARHVPARNIERLLTSNAVYVVGGQIVWFGLLMLFLWATLSAMSQAPFWRTVGWRSLPSSTSFSGAAWRYFFTGFLLAIFINVVSLRIRQPEKVPIQELLKDRTGALLVMGLAVLLAPLVEETVFRGYIYPLLARKLGVPAGIALTGIFFGLLHGAQLGWTWELVALLVLVGIVLTYVRARAGTVVASYFVHLGYNSMLTISAGIATHGFRSFPPGP